MNAKSTNSDPEIDSSSGIWGLLFITTIFATACYLALWYYGPSYDQIQITKSTERPIMWVIVMYAVAFIPCWMGTVLASRLPTTRQLVWWIIGTSVLFRILILPTPPFQEIDIYRYLWDGAVVTQGESPYRYPPDTIKGAIKILRGGGQVPDERLADLAQHAIDVPGLEDVLQQIHFADLPSPYPPVSQAVFTAPAAVTPTNWPRVARLNFLKTVLTGFDVATLLVVLALLHRAGKPLGLAIAYGWCPLVLKETANSGHLDSITIFFATAALYVGWVGMTSKLSTTVWQGLVGSALLLACGVAGKLYPVVLGPLLFIAWGRRVGWLSACSWALLFVAFSAGLMAPMLVNDDPPEPTEVVAAAENELPPAPGDNPPTAKSARVDSTAGISAFLSRWEMNDLAFMLIVEHLRPNDHYQNRYRPWFVICKDETSKAIVDRWIALIQPTYERLGLEMPNDPAFLLTRVVTAFMVLLIALFLAWTASPRPDRPDDATRWLRAAFMTLAWFWLLAPTQNPWYWCWALPLLPFMRLWSWHTLAAFSLMYYLRFWLLAYYPQTGAFGTPYDGKYFFFFVIAWIEFFPWMIALAVENIARWSPLARRTAKVP